MLRDPVIEADPNLGLCHLTLAFDRGSLTDPLGREGATLLLLRMMRRCHTEMSSEQLEATWDRLGAALTVEVTRTIAALHLTVLSRHLASAATLLSEVLIPSSWSASEFERLKQEALDDWLESLDDDATLARRAFSRAFFRGHAYSRLSGGNAASLKSVQLDDLDLVHAQIFAQDRAHLAISGTLPGDLDRILSQLSSQLPAHARGGSLPSDHVLGPGRRMNFVAKPDRTQAQILIGCQGARASDEDMVDLHIGHTAFGGTFGARLSEEVRVKRGWSYGAYSHLPIDRARQPFWCSAAAGVEDAAPCIQLMLELLEQLVARGISSSELRATKRYLHNSHPFSLDTAAKRAGSRLDQALHGHLPPRDYLDRVAQATQQSVNAALTRRLSSRDVVMTVLGSRGPLLDALQAREEPLEIEAFGD